MLAAASRRLAVAVLFILTTPPLAADALPRPAGLEPEIAFWRRIFTEVSTDQALVHDNRFLGVVYEKIDLPTGAGPAKQERFSSAARGKYERILRVLASGRRDGLTGEEARVLRLWPAGVSNAELRAAAERVRFQQGLADRFHAGLVRSGQWREHILQNLRAAGVPEELVALPHVESSFNPEAYSYVGASGLWQFTRDTGRRFMQVDHIVDERRDPYESSRAAARLLKYIYSVIGSWPLAISGYNLGLGGMRRAVQRMGTDDIEVIVRRYDGPAFGFASRNFYVSFLAALDVDRQPEKYFGPVRQRSPRQYLIVELPDYMKVETIERAFGVSRSTLQAYNPALLPPVWEGAKYVPRGFRLRLPGGVIDAPVEQVLDAIPQSQRFAAQKPDQMHRVRRGETLSGIAARYGTTVPKLMAANGLRDARRIRAGQTLRLPMKAESTSTPVGVASVPKPEPQLEPRAALDAANAAPPPAQPSVAAVAEAVVATALPAPPPAEKPRPAKKPEPKPAAKPAQVAVVLPRTPPTVVLAPFLALQTPPPAEALDPPAGLAVAAAGQATISPTDPNDYLVAADGSVEVQATETLSHYAEWLEASPETLRKANDWKRQRQIVLGQRVRLVFDKVSRESFIERRIAHHRGLQEDFFARYRITDTTEHELRAGESVWSLAQQKYKVPVWLLRQYNPDLKLDQVRPGTRVIFPRLQAVAAALDAAAVASAG